MSKRERLYYLNSKLGADIQKIVYISDFIAYKTDNHIEATILAEITRHYIKQISKNNEKIAKLYNL